MKGEEPNEEPEMHMVQVPASPKRSGDQQVELPDICATVNDFQGCWSTLL